MGYIRSLVFGVAYLVTAVAPALAQDYPSRTVTIVVPFTPGGSTDLLARLMAHKLTERLKISFVVENKPGAGTVIGANAVAKAVPDGYTLLMGTSSPMAINATLHKKLPYNPATDLVPLGMVAQSPFVLIVNPGLNVNSVAELIKLAKARNGELTYASAGAGSPHHLFMELFATMAGIKLTHVPYKGSLPALNDVVGGQVPVMFCDVPPTAGMIQSGKVRALGISTPTHSTALPGVAPISQSGVPGFSAVAWLALAAPGGTPQPIVDKLFRETKSILATGDVRDQISNLGLLPMENPSVPELRAFVMSEIARWGEVVKASGATAD